MSQKKLSDINHPDILHEMSVKDLECLAQDIREFLIESISNTGGHLASNLGVVELTLAIHRVFHSPKDKIVWDVGHQAYVHKILTGRRGRFDTLRKENGLSGFPKSRESEHDVFLGGHSSTSISAGYGISEALSLQGKDDYVIAVIGDGSFTGGMVYEAINNAGRSRNNLIVILNHNDMSISKNVGAVAKYLASMRSSEGYLNAKKTVEKALDKTPVVGKQLKRSLMSSKSAIKKIIYSSTWFEDMGFSYLGPVDGHDLKGMIMALRNARRMNGPVLVHVDTIKGKGYSFAEENPGAYHGISRFDVETGNPDIAPENSYSVVFGKALARYAHYDKRICAVTAAMKYGTGLQYFSSRYKNRFFDVGIAEQHAVTFCAGLASQGLIPVFAVYSSFLQRSYDQIIHDCAIENRHIVLGIDRAGIVGDDGETHQGVFDSAFLGTIPNVTVYSPESYRELEDCMYTALYHTKGVAAVRYPRGSESLSHSLVTESKVNYLYRGKGKRKLIVTYGRLTQQVCDAASQLGDVSVLKLIRIIPIPGEALQIASEHDEIYFFEEGMQSGGIAQNMMCRLYQDGYCGKFDITAIDRTFIPQGEVSNMLKRYGLDTASIVQKVQSGGKCGPQTEENQT